MSEKKVALSSLVGQAGQQLQGMVLEEVKKQGEELAAEWMERRRQERFSARQSKPWWSMPFGCITAAARDGARRARIHPAVLARLRGVQHFPEGRVAHLELPLENHPPTGGRRASSVTCAASSVASGAS
jgi:hypothetical protein